MVGRSQTAAFRPNPGVRTVQAPTRWQATAMLAALVLVGATIAVASFVVKPNRARAFDLFYGSVFLNDARAPVAVDLTNAKPTVRLVDANQQVNAASPANLQVVPLDGGTLLLNTLTGEFNMVDSTGFVVKTTGGGVPLPATDGPTTSTGVAAGDSSYIVQSGANGTSVYLVGAATVQAARNAGAAVKPRAFRIMAQPTAPGSGSEVSANGDLWLLAGTSGDETVTQLSVPRDSNQGATLTALNHGVLNGPAALGVASLDSDGSGGDIVASATPTAITVYSEDGSSHRIALSGLSGVDNILPATNQSGLLSFLFHDSVGWHVVTVGTDGKRHSGPESLSKVPASAQLTAPAASHGSLYVMNTNGNGQPLEIGMDGGSSTITGAPAYPLRTAKGVAQETTSFADAYAIAKGNRVIFNSPNNLLALAIFTDGSHLPVSIDKSSAVDLNSSGSAAALIKQHEQSNPTKTRPVKTPQQPPAPINNQLACKTTHQIPHIPTVGPVQPGSRSAIVRWSYPLLDPQDCEPSTYLVTVRLIGNNAPPAPAALTVQGQTGVTLTGLFPSTRYTVTVTALLNGIGTSSLAAPLVTGPEGPAAPTGVRVTTAEGGGWALTWNSCGGVQQGCVPATDWTVIPSFCDGTGVANPPTPLNIDGDPTAHTFTGQLAATDALLGRGLSFRIEGTGNAGTVGTPSAATACAYSWAAPDPTAMSVTASSPANASSPDGTTSTTVTLNPGSDPIKAGGGVGAQYTFQLLQGGSAVQTSGPTTKTAVTFDSLVPGDQYTARVLVSPPRHPEVSATVGPVAVQQAQANWPALGASASFNDDDPLTGTLTVSLSGITTADSKGETFDLVNSSLICGNTTLPLTATDMTLPKTLTYSGIDRSHYNGPCSVTVQVTQNSGTELNPPFYGPSASSTVANAGPFSIDDPGLFGVSPGSFQASWDGSSNQSEIRIAYTGSNPLIPIFTSNWSMAVSDNNGSSYNCGSGSNAPTTDVPVTQSCVDDMGGNAGQWQVTITFSYFGTPIPNPVVLTNVTGGPPPSYVPPQCDPSVVQNDLTASWAGTVDNPAIEVDTSSATQINACTNWSYVVVGPETASCGTDQNDPPPDRIPLTCTDPTSDTPWSVTVNFTDINNNQQSFSVPVTGSPPS